jgi:predicted GNAT family N-acyltransferase
MNISVMKIADPDELPLLFDIRHEVFVVGQNVPKEEENDEYELTSTHFLATCDGTMCGTARWRATEEGVKLERFAVLEEYRGKGVAKALLDAMLKDISKNKTVRGKKIYLHAQVYVVPFYEKNGFVPEGEEFVEAGIRHLKMYLPQ